MSKVLSRRQLKEAHLKEAHQILHSQGGVIMIVLRLLAVLIFSALLTGCDVGEDVKALKGEISALKDDITALKTRIQYYFPKPPCNPPGKHSIDSCFYRLKITQV